MAKTLLVTVVAVGVVGWLIVFIFAVASYSLGGLSNAGPFGDTFGVASSLFSMAAMIGAAIAVYYQHIELNEQRETQEKLLADQAKTSHAEAIRAVATSVTAWADLTARIPYKVEIKIPQLKLAVEEYRHRSLLEIFLDGLVNDKVLSVSDAKETERWRKATATIELSNHLVAFSERVTRDTDNPETQSDMKAKQSAVFQHYEEWKNLAAAIHIKAIYEPLIKVHSVAGEPDFRERLQNAIDALQKAINKQLQDELGIFKIPS